MTTQRHHQSLLHLRQYFFGVRYSRDAPHWVGPLHIVLITNDMMKMKLRYLIAQRSHVHLVSLKSLGKLAGQPARLTQKLRLVGLRQLIQFFDTRGTWHQYQPRKLTIID